MASFVHRAVNHLLLPPLHHYPIRRAQQVQIRLLVVHGSLVHAGKAQHLHSSERFQFEAIPSTSPYHSFAQAVEGLSHLVPGQRVTACHARVALSACAVCRQVLDRSLSDSGAGMFRSISSSSAAYRLAAVAHLLPQLFEHTPDGGCGGDVASDEPTPQTSAAGADAPGHHSEHRPIVQRVRVVPVIVFDLSDAELVLLDGYAVSTGVGWGTRDVTLPVAGVVLGVRTHAEPVSAACAVDVPMSPHV